MAGFLCFGERLPRLCYLVQYVLKGARDLVCSKILDGRLPHRCGSIELRTEEVCDVSGEYLPLRRGQSHREQIVWYLPISRQVGEVVEPLLDAYAAQIVEPGEGCPTYRAPLGITSQFGQYPATARWPPGPIGNRATSHRNIGWV